VYEDISRYYQQILDGTVTVGKWVRLAYEMIVEGLQNGQFFFDAKRRTAPSGLSKRSATTARAGTT
jgi:hypothetical protein